MQLSADDTRTRMCFVQESEEVEEHYCVVCEKRFRSAGQLSNHERSKKHLEALAELRQLLEEEEQHHVAKELLVRVTRSMMCMRDWCKCICDMCAIKYMHFMVPMHTCTYYMYVTCASNCTADCFCKSGNCHGSLMQ